jgi:hypothetical protein
MNTERLPLSSIASNLTAQFSPRSRKGLYDAARVHGLKTKTA